MALPPLPTAAEMREAQAELDEEIRTADTRRRRNRIIGVLEKAKRQPGKKFVVVPENQIDEALDDELELSGYVLRLGDNNQTMIRWGV